MCQCPISGALHFYEAEALAKGMGLECVNALSRAHFISTIMHRIDPFITYVCQCPISGALHFYPTPKIA